MKRSLYYLIPLLLAAIVGALFGDRAHAQDTADDVGTAGYDLQTGFGRINAKRAVDAVPAPNCVDGDGDGYFPTGGCGTQVDCNDGSNGIFPGAPEVCRDGIDQDCDGVDKLKGKCAKPPR